MCSITDHDNFEFDLYKRLKQEENKKNIKKVLPAVEFSVEIDNRVIHVITIFDDGEESKLRNIQKKIFNNGEKASYDSINKEAFKEKTFKDIISKIGLNVIMIAHQKNTIKSREARNNDVMTLGEDKFAELVFLDYFDVYEFKNSNNELFNKCYLEKNKKNISKEKLRFITGTDCHNWSDYSNELSKTEPVYLKCLPTFKGLSLAVTDYRRIKHVDSLFSQSRKFLDKIEIKIDDVIQEIPLSRGINVIIGNNSIGKSLLIHKLLKYVFLEKSTISNKYENYLLENKIEILTTIEKEDVYCFDRQGFIRKKFETKKFNLLENFKDRFPLDPEYIKEKNIIEIEIEKYFKLLEYKKQYNEIINKLQIFKIDIPKNNSYSLQIKKIKEKKEEKNLKELLDEYEKVLIFLNKIKNNQILKEKDNEIIEIIIKQIEELQINYLLKKEEENAKIQKISVINKILVDKDKELAKTKTDFEKKQIEFNNEKENVINTIIELINFKNCIVDFNPKIKEIEIKPVIKEVGDYNFISKCSIKRIDNEYILEKLKQPFKKSNKKKLNDIRINDLDDLVTNRNEELLVFEDYKNKIKENINKDFEIQNTILNKEEKDLTKEMSSGFNSKIYFDILSYDTDKNGIYIIDQPEDDVAPTSIKEYLLKNFKEMSENRQIILITHNPQFIVNLDVDNVIFLNKIKDKFCIESGALEYKNANYDILSIVSENIDGGIDTIKGRWKKYEKGI
jgi:predicted MPP superfamily phosphohydrolase